MSEPGTYLEFEAYAGSEPYAFISYSHRDTERVMAFLSHLRQQHCRFWYDCGIDPGVESWPQAAEE